MVFRIITRGSKGFCVSLICKHADRFISSGSPLQSEKPGRHDVYTNLIDYLSKSDETTCGFSSFFLWCYGPFETGRGPTNICLNKNFNKNYSYSIQCSWVQVEVFFIGIKLDFGGPFLFYVLFQKLYLLFWSHDFTVPVGRVPRFIREDSRKVREIANTYF